MSATPDSTSVNPEQRIVDLERQLADREAELAQAREQQTATAEVLQIINSSPGDLAPVFDAMLEKAMRLCGASFGALRRFDGKVFRAVAGRDVSGAAAVLGDPIEPDPGSASERLVLGEEVVHIPDVVDTEAYRSGVVSRLKLVEWTGARTALWVALRKNDVLLGDFAFYRKEVRPFSDKHIALLQNFAAQAVIAMENARLLTETREALEQQTATAEVLQVINSSVGDLAPVFGAMLEKATRLCDAPSGIFWTFDGKFSRATALHGIPQPYAEYLRERIPLDPQTGLGQVRQGKPIVIDLDVAAEEPYRTGNPQRRALVDLGRARSVVRAPLIKASKLLGILTVYRQEVRPFTDKQVALLQNFAAQAVIAMENARLLTETREALEQQTATAEVLQVINSSPGDLAPVFDAILEKAHKLCDSSHGSLFLRDGSHFRAAAMRGVPEPIAEHLRRGLDLDVPLSRPLLAGERFVHIMDMAQLAHPMVRLASESGVRALLSVPLRKGDELFGMIVAARFEAQPFSEKQIALLENFAAQAVIAMENARLLTETREALEQQTATAEVLGVINSSPGELAPVFDAMLEKAMRLCEAVFGVLNTYDGTRFKTVATRGVPAAFLEYRAHNVHSNEPGTLPRRILDGERVLHLPDLMDDDAYRAGNPNRRALVDLGGARTALVVALVRDEAVCGFITIYRQEVRPFTEKQVTLLQNFAAQAVIAMENARLLTETREALEQQTATAEVLGVINSSPGDLAPVFDAILEKARKLCGTAFGSLELYEGGKFRSVAAHGLSGPLVDHLRQPFEPLPGAPPARLIDGERSAQIADIAELAKQYRDDPRAQAAAEYGLRTVLFVPMRKGESLLGLISAGRKDVRLFTDKEIAVLQGFTAQAVIAMENARLLTETREALEQQTATAEVLQVINSSPGDLAPVFEAILEKAHNLCEVEYGTLQLYDGEKFRILTRRGFPEQVGQSWRDPYSVAPSSPLRALLKGEPLAEIPDVIAYQAETPNPRAEAAIAVGIRSVLFLPLRRDNLLLGVISAGRKEAKPFQAKEIALLQNFAAQAVIAMENARLLRELRARTGDLEQSLEYQTATSDVLKVISRSTFDLQPVLDTLCETAARLCDADFGALSAREGDAYRVRATSALVSEFDRFLRGQLFTPSRATVTGRALLERQTVHIPDAAADPELLIPEAITIGTLRTMLGVPLLHDGEPMGVFVLSRQRVEPFTERQIELVCTFADQAVIAIQNTRLLDELRQGNEEIAALNQDLEARVADQVDELGRVGRLKRFLAPQLAEMIIAKGDEKILESHRREIVVVFCDLRGYTAFTETAEPEEVLDFLREYHGALGPLVSQYEGTLDQFSGDGIMVFFNDPVPCPDPAERAVNMALAMRETASALIARWRRRGRELGFGAGIAQGYATLGQIGFAERSGYTAIGTVCNLAARLCAEAKDGQILVAQRVAIEVEKMTTLEEIGALILKGLTQPVIAFNVVQGTSPAGVRSNLTVVARNPRV